MTVARDLAEFLTRTSSADLPPQAVEHAAMLIASTLASAAMGAGLESSAIIRDLALERGGTSEASVWFDARPKLPASDASRVNAVMSDAAASDDSDLRNIVHAGTTLVATALAVAERTGARGGEVLTGHCPRLRGGGAHRRSHYPRLPRPRFSWLPRRDFCRCGRCWAAVAARPSAYGAGHPPVGDLDRRPCSGGEHERCPRVSRWPGGDARHPGSTRGAARVQSRREHPRSPPWVL